MKRQLSAWDLVDEVITEMSDENFSYWATERTKFRNILISEIQNYIETENVEVIDIPTERGNY